MSSLTQTAEAFFKACETGQGWEACSAFCKEDASFDAQAEPLVGVTTLQAYCDWMKALLGFMPDAAYEVKAFATDEARGWVVAYAVFTATHTEEGGPCPPTGQSTRTDYVYAMRFAGEKISHMTKIWHSGLAMKELGWA